MPTIVLNAVPLSATSVQMTGTVQDSNPSGVQILFGGIAAGDGATTNSSGAYSITAQNLSTGAITVIGQDMQQAQTNVSSAVLENPDPNVVVAVNLGPNNAVTVNGKVSGSGAGNQTITFSGVMSGSAVTDSNGNFTLTGTASGYGNVTASIPSILGSGGSTTKFRVAPPPPPVITTIEATVGPKNVWTVTGNVGASSDSGLYVTIGLPNDTQVTALCDASGNFKIAIALPAGCSGVATAIATDCWGQNSPENEVDLM